MLNRLLFVFIFLIPSFVWAENNPYHEMAVAAEKTFTQLQQQRNQIRTNPDRLRDIVRQQLLPYVQIKYAGALILGRYYKDATNSQRDTYFNAFENYLVKAFSQALTLYDGQQYSVEPAKSIDGKDIVSIRISLIQSNNQPPIRLDFQWRKNSVTGDWKAYDMIAEGVSMINTKQSEWAALLRQKGIDALTTQLVQLAKEPVTFENK